MILNFLKDYDHRERVALWISLAIHVCCAWFSLGYHYDDEHWQLLEFANYKLGLSPASDLPWEFTSQIRPTLQPFIVIILAKALMAFKLYNPFTVAFILRLVTALLSWFASLLVVKSSREFLRDKNQQYLFILFASFLWFAPYIHVRFSGETWSGLFFLFGLYLLLAITEKGYSRSWIIKSLLVGICFGISFWCRFQIVFAVVGIGVWLLFFRTETIVRIVPAIASGIVLLGIGILLDHAFYNQWVFTPYRYFESNIINNVAARYGVSPWWDYFWLFILQAGIPISLVLLGAVFLSLYYHPKNPYTWIFLAFLTGHMLIGHKEMRFLFPMIYLFPILCFLFVASIKKESWLKTLAKSKSGKLGAKILVTMNLILLVVVVFVKPPAENVLLYRYVYNHTNGKPVKIITLKGNPYTPGHLRVNFYSPPNFEIVTVENTSELKGYAGRNDITALFFDDHFELSDAFLKQTDVDFELVYRTHPSFIKNLNFNGWVDRQKIHALYAIK